MKKLIAMMLLSTAIGMAHADDILIRDGASCTIPDTFNIAPYDELYNPNGMSEFCVFPLAPIKEALQNQLQGLQQVPNLPECVDNQFTLGGRSEEVFPCYEVKES